MGVYLIKIQQNSLNTKFLCQDWNKISLNNTITQKTWNKLNFVYLVIKIFNSKYIKYYNA